MNLTFGPAKQMGYVWAHGVIACGFPSCMLSPTLVAYGDYPAYGQVRASVAKINEDGTLTLYHGGGLSDGVDCIGVCALTETKFVLLYGNYPSLYAVVAVFTGSSVTVGTPVSITGMVAAAEFGDGQGHSPIAALDSSSFVLIGRKNQGSVLVGVVSGTSISFGATVQFVSSYPNYLPSVCALSSTTFAILYTTSTDYTLRLVIGTRSGSTVTVGLDAGVQVGPANYQARAGMVRISPNLIAISYYDATLRRATRCVSVSGTTPTLKAAVAIDSAETTYAEAATIMALPPYNDTLFPRRVLAVYRRSISGVPTVYGRIGNVSASGTVSFTDAAASFGITATTDGGFFIPAMRDWRILLEREYVPNDYNRYAYGCVVDIAPMTLGLSFSLSDSVAASESRRFSLGRPVSEAATISESVLVLPDYHFFEELGVADSVARALSITRTDALQLIQGLYIDGMYVGGACGYWRRFNEGLTLTVEEATAIVKQALLEHSDLVDRLRLGGMWDEPTTRIVTSILKAAVNAERL